MFWVKGVSFFREGRRRGVLGSKTGPLLLGPVTFTLTSFDFPGAALICKILFMFYCFFNDLCCFLLFSLISNEFL